MAFSEGGTAGDSVSHGNGSNSASHGFGGGNNGGHQGSDSSSSTGGGNNPASGMAGAMSAGPTQGALSAAAPSDNKQTGGIMSGLMSSVAESRAGKAMSAASTPGQYGNETTGSVSNSVGAMNTPEAQQKAESMGLASRRGYAGKVNADTVGTAFGVAPGIAPAAAGKAVGAAVNSNPYGKDTDEAASYAAGAREAEGNMIGGAARTGIGLAAGLLGGPVGSMIANLAMGLGNRVSAVSAHPSAFDSSRTPSATPSGANGPGGNFSSGGAGGVAEPTQNMMNALATPTPQSSFEMAGDYDRNSYQKLNLGSII